MSEVDRFRIRSALKAIAFAAAGFVLHDFLYGGILHGSPVSVNSLQPHHPSLPHQHPEGGSFAASSIAPNADVTSGKIPEKCGPDSDLLVSSAVRAAVTARRTYQVSGGPPFTPAAIMNVHPCVRASSRQWSLRKDVLFIVMAGTVLRERVRAIWDTWGRYMKDTGNMIIMSDAAVPELHMITVPEIENRTAKEDGSHRSLRGLQYAMSQPQYSKFSWIALVDDDTWVNAREIPSFLYGWNPAAPLMFGFFWNSPWFKRESSWPSGPFMLLSRSAAELMAPRLYKECPFEAINDITLGSCSWSSGVALVHTPLVDPEGVHFLTDKTYMKMSDNDGDIRTLLAIHRMEPNLMRDVQAIADRYPVDWHLADPEAPPESPSSTPKPSPSPPAV